MRISVEKPGTPAELVHAGIKGMKWGVRKKREVSPERKAKREAKAQKFVKKASATQTKIDAVKAKPKLSKMHSLVYDRNARIAELEQIKTQALKDAESKRQGKLSRRQKQVIIGSAVVGTLLIAGTLAVTMNSGQARQAMNRGREFVTREKFKFDQNPKLAQRDLSPEQLRKNVVLGINSKDFMTNPGAKMNCRRCTFAYEMRRRGYDVSATKTPTASGQNSAGLLNAITTKNPDVSTRNKSVLRRMNKNNLSDPATRHVKAIGKRGGGLKDFKDVARAGIFRRLEQEPERSRGEIAVQWLFGGGHSMAYEIINGKANIFDAQTGKHYDSPEAMAKDFPSVARGGFTRLDNVELDTHFLERWVKNA